MISIYTMTQQTPLTLPLMIGGISAGFPSPAQDFIDIAIDLNKELIKHPTATFFARVSGESMKDAGINDGDLLVVDRSINPKDGMIAVCFVDGEFTLKQIKIDQSQCWLIPANKNYRPIKVTADNDFIIWGIVKHVIKSF